MGQLMVPENLILIGVFLLALIALLLLVLIGLVKKQVRLLTDFTSAQQPGMNQSTPVLSEEVPEEDVAVISAVIAEMLPGAKIGAIQIHPVSK